MAIPAFPYIRNKQSYESWPDEQRRVGQEMYRVAVAQREQAAEMFATAQQMSDGARLMRDKMR